MVFAIFFLYIIEGLTAEKGESPAPAKDQYVLMPGWQNRFTAAGNRGDRMLRATENDGIVLVSQNESEAFLREHVGEFKPSETNHGHPDERLDGESGKIKTVP
ncbi:MAG: hypothetical protein IJI34_05670 [Clostridia bacterium]|nr:hypothetical protein [Clostridia bacterium]